MTSKPFRLEAFPTAQLLRLEAVPKRRNFS
jgi:hypothetical protein